MTKRICITIPDKVSARLDAYMNTYPSDKKKNVSSYIADLIEKHCPIILID